MTKQEFTDAVETLTLLEDEIEPTWNEAERRVFAASTFVMRDRLDLPDNVSWQGPTPAELVAFLKSLSPRKLKLLKQIADELNETIGRDH